MSVKATRLLIVLVIGGGVVYALLLRGIVYAIAFMIALLAWLGREVVWSRGSGYRGGFIKDLWGSDDGRRMIARGAGRIRRRSRPPFLRS